MAFQIEFQGSLTKDEIICDQRGGDSWISQEGFIGGDFLTINPKECTVRWFSEGGQAVVRLFQFSQAPLDAIFCLLNENMTVPDPSFSFDFKENRRLCVAVLTTSHELHLYYQTGDKYEIMLPATSKYLLATSAGLLIQATMFNVQENFLPIELDQPDDDFDPNQLLFPTTEIQETNMILYLNSPNSTVDVIPSSLSEAYANYQLSSSYYNWISLYHVKGNAFVIASLDPVTKNEKSKEEFNVLDHTLSPSSLLQRSLNSESGEFKEFDKSGFLVNQSHVSSHSKGSKRMSITPGSGQRVRPPSRSSPSPTVFTKALTGITQFPTASPTHNQTRVSPSGIMETSVGSGVNQYSGETLHNLLGLKRQTSRDQDRNLTGINMPNAAANQSRLSGGLSGSLEKSHSVEDIDFTMNTLIDGIYNDILPLSEANIVFSLKALESIPEFIGNEGKSPAESGTGDSKLTITFIGNLKEQLLLLIHIQRIKVLKIYQIRSIDNLVSNLSPSWTTSSPIELVHKQDLSSLDDSSFSVCSYSFYSSAVLQSSSAIWKVPIILQNSVSGFSINVVGTRTSFSFPSGNVKDQESWISQLLSLDESEEADQISFGQHLGGVVQSLNYQFSNFILDHQKKKKIGRLSFITPSSVEDHQAQAMIIIFQLFKQVFVGFENFLSVVSALWIRLSFMTNFQQRNEFFLVIFFLLLNSDQSSTSLSDQVQILLNTCYDDGAREDLSNLIQEMLVHLPTGEVALNLTKKALFSILLVQFEMSLLDNSSLNSVSPRFTLKVSTYIHQLLSQIKHFMLVTYRSWSNTASVKFFESFYQIIENNANHDILDVLFQKSLPFQKDFLELIDQMKLSSFSSLFVVFTFLNKLRANETALGHKESASVRVVVAFIEAVQLLFNSGVGIPEKLSIISERQWNDVLHRLPAYLQYLLILSFELSRYDASPSWPIAVLKWMNRNDLCGKQYLVDFYLILTLLYAANLNKQVPAYLTRRTSDHSSAPSSQQKTSSTSSTIPQVEEISDGLLEVENESILRFPEDDRMHEVGSFSFSLTFVMDFPQVCRLLRSSLPCYLNLERSPEQSEPEFRQKQQMRLLTLCRRTLSCPVGRGMLTIGTTEPLMAEALAIPPLSLNGRVPPTNSIVSLDLSTAHVDLKLWPEFHNGVAAALRVGPAEILQRVNSNSSSTSSSNPTSSTVPSKKRVTRNWIIYNKTASQAKQGGDNGHAGFLLGMGLFGHLSVLTITDICDYLTQGHEPTTIGILIGVAASKISTADALLSKTLCLHLPTLLPAQHWDIEISPLIQCSALVGLGFLYCRSGHRLIVQFLLEELSRKPTSDRCECREALALSAAWALAMVLLPKKLCSPPASTNISSERRQNYEDLSPSSNHSMQTSPVQHETDSPPSASFVTNTSTSRLAIPPSPFRPATKAAAAAVVGGGMTVEDLSAGNQNEVLKSLHDLKIEDCLHTFISGGSRPSDLSLFPGHHGSNGSHQQSYDVSAKSSRVLEGDHINRDVTSPGACIALGLIYISTNHSKILRFLELPQTVIELDSIRPDLLLYRCIGRCLIQWEYSIQPTKEWLDEQIPSAVQKVIASALEGTGGVMGSGATKPKLPKYVGPYGRARHSQSELSPSTAFSLYVNIITGYCLGIGVVFAGTFHPKAKELILSNLKWLQSLRENKGAKKLSFTLDKTHRNMIEMCISSVSLALSCVMAGSGDVDCLRILRELRWKVDDVIYGTHLALNMAIGLLFLGGGKYSLKRDPVSTACLLISILPRFPSRTIDHQYHLQALRHLYVLAVESRVLHTVDVDTGLPISVDLQLELISGEKTVIKVPGLLPQLNTVKSISVIESKQWEISDEVEGTDEKKHCNQYYPCRIDLASSSSALSHSVGGSAGRSSASTNQRILLPTFYVKKVPSAISVSANHSLTEMKEQSIIPPSSIRDRSSMIRALMSHQFTATENKESKSENSSPIAQLVSSWIVQTPDLQDILFRSLQKEL